MQKPFVTSSKRAGPTENERKKVTIFYNTSRLEDKPRKKKSNHEEVPMKCIVILEGSPEAQAPEEIRMGRKEGTRGF